MKIKLIEAAVNHVIIDMYMNQTTGYRNTYKKKYFRDFIMNNLFYNCCISK